MCRFFSFDFLPFFSLSRRQQEKNVCTQTEGTVCTREPMKSLLGRYGDTEFCSQVLQGMAQVPEAVREYVQQLLEIQRWSSQSPQQYLRKTFKMGGAK